MIKVGIIGCGNIGRFVIKNLDREEFKALSLRVVSDLPSMENSLRGLAETVKCDYTIDPANLIDWGLDAVLEAANPVAVKQYVPPLLRKGITVIAMSVGAFADAALLAECRTAAEASGCRLLLPTGGIAGLDNLKAAQLAGIEEAILTMTKPPKALAGAPYFESHPIDLFSIEQPTTVFDGTAGEAIKGFPANVNVAVALSLATLGPQRTKLRVVCDPKMIGMVMVIDVRGGTGKLKMEITNLPSPDNPKTSYQACCSALATLRRLVNPVQLGT